MSQRGFGIRIHRSEVSSQEVPAKDLVNSATGLGTDTQWASAPEALHLKLKIASGLRPIPKLHLFFELVFLHTNSRKTQSCEVQGGCGIFPSRVLRCVLGCTDRRVLVRVLRRVRRHRSEEQSVRINCLLCSTNKNSRCLVAIPLCRSLAVLSRVVSLKQPWALNRQLRALQAAKPKLNPRPQDTCNLGDGTGSP